MSSYSGPSAAIKNLVLGVDGANRKSYAGIGIERLGGITGSWNNWAGMTGTSTTYVSKSGGSGVFMNSTSNAGGGVNYWNSITGTLACTASTTYVVSARFKSNITPSANMFYVRQFNGGAQTSEAGYFNSSYTIPADNGFSVAYGYFTTDATANNFYIHGYEYTAPSYIYLEDVQCKIAGMQNIVAPDGSLDEYFYNGARITTNNNGVMFFDGSNDYAGSTATPTISFYSGGTMEMWVKLTTIGIAQGFFSFAGGGSYIDFWMPSYNQMRWEVIGTTGSGYTTINSTTTFTTGVWYHVVGVFTSVTTTIYVNGVAETTQTMTNQPASVTAGVFLANYSSYTPSSIACAKLYNRALTANEVKQSFQALRGRFGI